ncbi:hypothetical protein ABZ502_23420 [Streptomyces abikoensis]|uniref:hypothetical protein n=1 Tax=Streptomyces abikoensis TaxID=97398 RepID=UPI0033C7F377
MATALVVSALCVYSLSGCSSEERDERAYPGSPSGQSLESVLKRFDLQLPSCEIENVGFAGSSHYPEEALSLSFRAPKGCVDSFLKKYGVIDVEKPFTWPSAGADPRRDSYFLEEDAQRFGWKFDRSRQYNPYRGFQTPNGSLFKVLVDPSGVKETVYMQATFVGGS